MVVETTTGIGSDDKPSGIAVGDLTSNTAPLEGDLQHLHRFVEELETTARALRAIKQRRTFEIVR